MDNKDEQIKSTEQKFISSSPSQTSRQKLERFIGRFKIRTVLTFSLVVIIIIAMGITGLLAFFNSQYAVSDLSSQLQSEISDRIVQHLNTYLETPHQINRLCISSINLGEINIHEHEGLERHFQELSYEYQSFESIFFGSEENGNYTIIASVGAPGLANGTERFLGFARIDTNSSFEEYRIDRNGNKLEKTYSIPQYDPRTRPWYKSTVEKGGPGWTPIYMWLEGVVSQDATTPVYSANHTLLGVLGTSMTLTGIGDFVQSLQISKNGQAFIIERNGDIVAASTIKEPYSKVNGTLDRLSALECNDSIIRSTTKNIIQIDSELRNTSTRQTFSYDLSGERQLVQVTPYKDSYGLDWLIVVVIPESDIMDKINANNRTTLFLAFLSVIGTMIVCVFLAKWITKPILLMNQSAKRMARGEWTNGIKLDRRDELGELAHSFSDMASQLRSSFASLKSSEERYMSLFQSSADAILLFDEFTLMNINKAGEEMFGVKASEVIGQNVSELFQSFGKGIEDMIRSANSSPHIGSYKDVTLSRVEDGHEEFINIRLTELSSEGKILNLFHIRDITEQRQAYIAFAEQQALRESYAHIQMILQLLPDPTFVIDSNGKILFWNLAIERMTGKSAEEMIGKGDYAYSECIRGKREPILIDIALHPESLQIDDKREIERIGDVFKTSYWSEKSGEMRFLSITAARLYDKNGDLNGAIESIRDITTLKTAEEALLIANKKLNLLSSITRHDVMNKIMISKAHIYFLEQYEVNDEQKSSIEVISRSLTSIENFITFTKTYQELGVRVPVWQDVEEAIIHAEKEVGSDISIDHEGLIGLTILADPLFGKVCYNLIENAIRHGEHVTQIIISSQEIPEGIRITFKDNGVGVEEDLKETIFDRGYGKNTGYGLFLSREILLLTGITIKETGTFGSGCRFEIDVPTDKYHNHE